MTEPKKRRWPFVVGASACPPLGMGATIVLVLVLALTSRDVARALEDLEGASILLLVLGLLSTVVTTVLVGLSAAGFRIPAAATLLVAAFPWIASSLSIIIQSSGLAENMAGVEPEQRAILFAQFVSGGINGRALGALIAGTLLGSACISLGVAAIGQRAPNRSWVGALIGFGTTSLLSFVAVLVGVLTFARLSVGLLMLPVFAGTIGATLAAWGAGDDQPHGRASALAAASPVMMGVACAAGAVLMSTYVTVEIFSALAYADPSQRASYMAHGAEQAAPLKILESWGAVVFFLPALGVGIWAAAKSRASVGRIIGAVAAVFAVALVFSLDALSLRVAGGAQVEAANLPWEDHEGFEPLELRGSGHRGDVDAVVNQTEVVTRNGDRHPVSSLKTAAGIDGLVAQWRKLLPPRPARGGEGSMGPQDPSKNVNRYGIRDDERVRKGSDRIWITNGRDRDKALLLDLEPSISVAVDRRVGATELQTLASAASEAGATSIVFVGAHSLGDEGSHAANLEKLRRLAPFLVAYALSVNTHRALLPAGMPPGFAAQDENFYHGTIGKSARLTLDVRQGSRGEEKTIDPDNPSRARIIDSYEFTGEERRSAMPLAYVRLSPDAASAEHTLKMLDAVADSGMLPVLMVERGKLGRSLADLAKLPFQPEAPERGAANISELRLGGFGKADGTGLGRLTDGAPVRGKMKRGRASIVGGPGTLSADSVRRTVGRALGGIKGCYERSLRREPTLMGRMTVVFTIGGGGRVVSAESRSSTLPVEVNDCIVSRIRSLRFAPPEGGNVDVSYPFFFAPTH